MDTTPDVIVDLNGNVIAIDADAKEAIFRGKDFLTRVNLEPPYGRQSLRFIVVEMPGQSGAYEIRDSIRDGEEILGNLEHDSALAVLVKLSVAIASAEEDDPVFSSDREKSSCWADALSFLYFGMGFAIVAFPVAGMARMGWELAARFLGR